MSLTYGEVIHGLSHNGRELRASVFNEHEVRTAAGLTMAIGAVAFAYANFAHQFVPIKIVTTLFFVEFLIRVTIGLKYSPTGILAHWLMRRAEPQWVSARPKRFAWMLGMLMSGAMVIITNSNIHGALPRTICLLCLALMWSESVLGLCIGCELHGLLVRSGLATKDEAFEICANGACDVVPGRRQ